MPFLTATPWLMPAITGGMGIYSALKGQQMQQQALDEAKKPRFTEEMADYARKSGTSNIQANLASRGLIDSSMLPGGIASLEGEIAKQRAGAGTMGDVPGMLWQGAMGLGSGGAQTLGSLYEGYMLQRLLGSGARGGWQDWWTNPPAGSPSTVPSQYGTQNPWWWGSAAGPGVS